MRKDLPWISEFPGQGFFQLCLAGWEGKVSTSRSTLKQQLSYCLNTRSLPPSQGCHKGRFGFVGAVCFGFGRIRFVLEIFFLLDNQHLGRCHRFHQCGSLLRLFFLDWAPSLRDQHGVSWSFQMKLGKWAGWLASALRCTKRRCREGAFARRSNKCNFLHELAVPHWLQRGQRENKKRATVC